MPDIVIEVSATFVARITFRVFGGAILKALFCSDGVRRAYNGHTSICKMTLASIRDYRILFILTCIFLLSKVGR